jgi:hypothetical protein
MRVGVFLACLLAGILLTPICEAARILSGIRTEKESGISIKISNFYEDIPPRGFLPLRVEIGNESGRDASWDIQTAHAMGDMRSVSYSRRLSVAGGSRKSFDLLVPVLTQPSQGSVYSNLVVTATGPGLASNTAMEYSTGGSSPHGPYVGMGNRLAAKNWGLLREALRDAKKPQLSGSQMDVDFLPGDWRAMAGFDVIVFSGSEWEEIPADPRRALMDWVAQGGVLVLFAEAASGLPDAGSFGAGEIIREDPSVDLPDACVGILDAVADRTTPAALGEYSWEWAPAAALGRSVPPQGLIISFVLAFAVLIGPVNFLVFAPTGRRHRLIWTTPLISVSATVLMAAGIAASEGFGGRGERIVLQWQQADESRTVHWQEQVSRTGVVISSRFEPGAPALILPLHFHAEPRSRGGIWAADTARFALNSQPPPEGTWHGDWFRSRSTQGQALIAVEPGRERIEFRGSPPQAQSTMASTVEELWYWEAADSVWFLENLEPGGLATMKKGDPATFEAWWKNQLSQAGPLVSQRADSLRAKANRPQYMGLISTGAIATLEAIQWSGARTLLVGQPSL